MSENKIKHERYTSNNKTPKNYASKKGESIKFSSLGRRGRRWARRRGSGAGVGQKGAAHPLILARTS